MPVVFQIKNAIIFASSSSWTSSPVELDVRRARFLVESRQILRNQIRLYSFLSTVRIITNGKTVYQCLEVGKTVMATNVQCIYEDSSVGPGATIHVKHMEPTGSMCSIVTGTRYHTSLFVRCVNPAFVLFL